MTNIDTSKDLSMPFVDDPIICSLEAFQSTNQSLSNETMLGVQNARVVFANYQALRHDFSSATRKMSESQIDEWLISNTAFVSSSQAKSSEVSTCIALNGSHREAVRPPRYGRAAVMVESQPELLCTPAVFDVKGIGVPPDEAPHLPNSNGLMTLDEAVHEVLMEHIVNAIMSEAGLTISALPSYAVIDLGFDALHVNGLESQRAVALVRRSATRPSFQWQRDIQGAEVARLLMQIELLLRQAGISASMCGAVRIRLTKVLNQKRVFRDETELDIPNRRKEALFDEVNWKGEDIYIDGVNVQITSGYDCKGLQARLMDFGRYRFASDFASPLYSWVDADYLSMNGVYLSPDCPQYNAVKGKEALSDFEQHSAYMSLITAQAAYQSGDVSACQLAVALKSAIINANRLTAGAVCPTDAIRQLEPNYINLP